jgi:hypothetical protein
MTDSGHRKVKISAWPMPASKYTRKIHEIAPVNGRALDCEVCEKIAVLLRCFPQLGLLLHYEV